MQCLQKDSFIYDVLIEIFLYCVWEEDDNIPFTNHPPWNLLGVCQSWRSTALSAGRLWRHLPPLTDKSKLPMVQFLLAHSAPYGVSFFLKQHTPRDDSGVFALLMDTCERWETVALSLSQELYLEMESTVPGRLSKLTGLGIETVEGTSRHSCKTFLRAPNLRHVVVNRGSKMQPCAEPSLPWQDLKDCQVHTRRANLPWLFAGLAEARRLQTFVLDLPDLGPLHIPKISLPFLTDFTLETHLNFQWTPLFSSLSLPSLLRIQIDVSEASDAMFEGFVAMIRRCGCTLELLTILSQPKSLTSDRIGDILEITPKIRSLRTNIVSQQLFTMLCSRNDSGGWKLAPLLDEITIHFDNATCDFKRLALARCDLIDVDGTNILSCKPLQMLNVAAPLCSLEPPFPHDPNFDPSHSKSKYCQLYQETSALLGRVSSQGQSASLVENRKDTLKCLHDALSLLGQIQQRQTGESLRFYYENIYAKFIAVLHSMPREIQQNVRLKRRLQSLHKFLHTVFPSSEWAWVYCESRHLRYIPRQLRM